MHDNEYSCPPSLHASPRLLKSSSRLYLSLKKITVLLITLSALFFVFGSVVSLRFLFAHPPEDGKKNKQYTPPFFLTLAQELYFGDRCRYCGLGARVSPPATPGRGRVHPPEQRLGASLGTTYRRETAGA